MDNDLKCPICGKPTYLYFGNPRKDKLCETHGKMANKGEIVLCEKCKKYHSPKEDCKISKKGFFSFTTTKKEEKKCIICSNLTSKGDLCLDCYHQMLEYKESFDRNKSNDDMYDWYFNLKSSIFRMTGIEYINKNCLKLIGLAELHKALYNTSLSNRVVNDVTEILKAKASRKDKEETAVTKEKDSHKEELIRTQDGHRVKSKGEETIDDILYSELRICHCYEKNFPVDADEESVKCDWFIPIKSTRSGIYIEYWGRTDKEYLENKERKRASYKRHNAALIEIEKDEPNSNKSQLIERLIKEINQKANQYFDTKDFIK